MSESFSTLVLKTADGAKDIDDGIRAMEEEQAAALKAARTEAVESSSESTSQLESLPALFTGSFSSTRAPPPLHGQLVVLAQIEQARRLCWWGNSCSQLARGVSQKKIS